MSLRLLLALATALLAHQAIAGRVDVPYRIAVLRGLDKITARVRTFEAPVGETVGFGTLEIRVEACFRSPPVEPPEAAAFLVIDAVDPGRPRRRAFSGWMFASSPSLSALEHPVYDVWLLDCRERLEGEEDAAAAPPSTPQPPSAEAPDAPPPPARAKPR